MADFNSTTGGSLEAALQRTPPGRPGPSIPTPSPGPEIHRFQVPTPRASYYLYRCTTDKLVMHLERIGESGDLVVHSVFVGGRDWVLICAKANS